MLGSGDVKVKIENILEHPMTEKLLYRRLNNSRGRMSWMVCGLWIAAIIAATVPLWMYIGTGGEDDVLILFIIGLPILLLHFWTILRTVFVGISITRPLTSDLVLMAGGEAKPLVFSAWKKTIQITQRSYLFAAIPRLALTWGFAQYLRTTDCTQFVSDAFCYGDYRSTQHYPHLIAVLLTFVLLLGFAFLECRLTAALAVLGAARSTKAVNLGFYLRLGLAVVAVVTFIGIEQYRDSGGYRLYLYEYYTCGSPVSICQRSPIEVLTARGVVGAQLFLSSLIDGGMMSVEVIIRPTFADWTKYLIIFFDELPRPLVAMLPYPLLTFAALRFAQFSLVRRGFLPPERKRQRKHLLPIVHE